ncbi:type IV secretory system conjugative DNA transfer family protein [Gordonia phosphorivorans]|uniref:Type IV secretory system conjugative DNA transfer family protein n=1 Tax=Gordonia phosphorivorans TaxID=1056982 RepID=A0ABV6HC91_9ACTN
MSVGTTVGDSSDLRAEGAVLTITGLRPRGKDESNEPVLDAVISMLRLVPGTELNIEAGSEVLPGSEGPSTLMVRLDSQVDAIPDEFALVLDEDVTTDWTIRPHLAREHVWRGRPEAAGLGFRPRRQTSSTWDTVESVTLRDRARLWKALSRWHGGRIEVAITAVDQQWFTMSVTLVGESTPPLGLLAALRDNFPGLVFTPDTPEMPECGKDLFRCDESEVRLALLLPVGPDSPVGFLAGAPAGLPVSATVERRRTGGDRGVTVGIAKTDAGLPLDVTLGDKELLRHMHIVGATGTGKSTLLAGLVHELAHSDNGALVLDPHGSLVDRILAELPASAAERCMVVRAADLDHPMPLNPLHADDAVSLATAISDIGAMFQELFDRQEQGIVGPRFIERINHALRGLVLLRGKRASLLDVPLMLSDKAMIAEVMKKLTDRRELVWWQNEVGSQRKSSEYGDLVSWVNSKFEAFSASPALAQILASGQDVYHPATAMDTGQIVLVDLAKGQMGASASRLLGYLLLNRFWVAAMNRQTDRRFHVIVDEAHSVMAGSLVNMLSEGRKFGISVTAAHQYLGQLDNEVAQALTGNVGTSVIFRANGPHVAEHVATTGGAVGAATLANLPMFHAIVTRNEADGVSSAPFTMTVDPRLRPQTCDRAALDDVMASSYRHLKDLDLGRLDPADFRSSEPEPPPPSSDTSFLDDWLTKRRASGGTPSSGGTVLDS